MDMCGMVIWEHLFILILTLTVSSGCLGKIGAQEWRCHHPSGPCTATPLFWSRVFHLSCQRSLCCGSACWLLSFHWAPLRRFGSAFIVCFWHSGRCTWGTICCFSPELKKPISLGVSLHTMCSSPVAATGLKPVTIHLTLGTQTGHSAPHTALAVPGSREHSPDNYLRDSHFRMTWRKQLNLEWCAYYNHNVWS